MSVTKNRKLINTCHACVHDKLHYFITPQPSYTLFAEKKLIVLNLDKRL